MAVRQKSKKGPITVEADWDWRDLQGPTHLLVRASLDDWKKVILLPRAQQDGFFQTILSEAKAKVRDSDRNLPRGLLKEEFNFIQKMRLIALFTSGIIKNCSGTGFYKRLVKECGQIIGGHRGKRRDPKIHELTAFVLDEIFAEEKKRYSIRKWADDPDNFKRTYLDWKRAKKTFDPYLRQSRKDFGFYSMIQDAIVCQEFKRYIKRRKPPLKVFELFFKERSYLMERPYFI